MLGALSGALLTGLAQGAMIALVALGYTMVYGVLKLINFAHSEVFMMGAYAGFFFMTMLGGAEHPVVAAEKHGTGDADCFRLAGDGNHVVVIVGHEDDLGVGSLDLVQIGGEVRFAFLIALVGHDLGAELLRHVAK